MTQQDSVNLLVEVAKRAQKAGILELQEAYLIAIAVEALREPLPVLPVPEPTTASDSTTLNEMEVVDPQPISSPQAKSVEKEDKEMPLQKV